MAFSLIPSASDSTIASQVEVVYGIEETLTGYILQDLNITKDVSSYQIPDQHGDIAQVHNLQKHWTVSLTAIGPNSAPAGGAGNTFTMGGIKYYIQSCERRATYNDTQKWALQVEAWQDATVGGDSSKKLGPTA